MSDSGRKKGKSTEASNATEPALPEAPEATLEAGDLPWIPNVMPSLTGYFKVQVATDNSSPGHSSEVATSAFMAAEGDFEDEDDEHPFELTSTEPLDPSYQLGTVAKVTRELPTTKVVLDLDFEPESLLDSKPELSFALLREEETGKQVQPVLPELLIPEPDVVALATAPQLKPIIPEEHSPELLSAREDFRHTPHRFKLEMESLDPDLLAEAEAMLELEEKALQAEAENSGSESSDGFGSSINLEETHHGLEPEEVRKALVLEDPELELPEDSLQEPAEKEPSTEALLAETEPATAIETDEDIDLEETYAALASFELEFSGMEQEVLTLNVDSEKNSPSEDTASPETDLSESILSETILSETEPEQEQAQGELSQSSAPDVFEEEVEEETEDHFDMQDSLEAAVSTETLLAETEAVLAAGESFAHDDFVSSPDLSGIPEGLSTSFELWPSAQVLLDVDPDSLLPYEGLGSPVDSGPDSSDFERVPSGRLAMTSTSDFSASQASLLQAEQPHISSEMDFYPIELLKQPSTTSKERSEEREQPVFELEPLLLEDSREEVLLAGELLSREIEAVDDDYLFDDDEDDQPIIELHPSLTLDAFSEPVEVTEEAFSEPAETAEDPSFQDIVLPPHAQTSFNNDSIQTLDLTPQFDSIPEPETDNGEHTLDSTIGSSEIKQALVRAEHEEEDSGNGAQHTLGDVDTEHLLKKMIAESEATTTLETKEPFFLPDNVSLEDSLQAIESGDERDTASSQTSEEQAESPLYTETEPAEAEIDSFLLKEELLPSEPLLPASEPFGYTDSLEELPPLAPEFAGLAAQDLYEEESSKQATLDSQYQPSEIGGTATPSRVEELILPMSGETWPSSDTSEFDLEEGPVVLLTPSSQTLPAMGHGDLSGEPSVLLTSEHSSPSTPVLQPSLFQQEGVDWPGWLPQPSLGVPGWAGQLPPAMQASLTGLDRRPLNPSEQQVMSLLRALQEVASRAACFVVRGPVVLGLCGVGEYDIQRRIQEVFFPMRLPSIFSSVASVRSGYLGPLSRRSLDQIVAACLGPIPSKVMVYPIFNGPQTTAFYYLDDVGSRRFPRKVEAVRKLMKHASFIDYNSTMPASWPMLSSHLMM
jgi:hypothetical protein